MSSQKSIADLQLSEEEWAKKAQNQNSTDLTNASSPTMKIVGQSEDVKAFLKKCSGTDADYINVWYSVFDSFLWVMGRVEGVIRVPMQRFALAGDGMIYSPGHLVMGMKQLKNGTELELILLPSWECES
ncbi:hypothetical protein BYT27DRAFT_6742641 [Phlegmacium glaucopus]|nr:hypothetical protein BYT27DRAFT_6742641 [Phlegmacium glaucopus]